MEFINFLFETNWMRTKIPAMLCLFISAICVVIVIVSLLKIVGRKSKELYFQIYITSASLIFFQCTMLLAATGSSYQQLIAILAFVYFTAILILFLIFLALITSEVFYERAMYNKVVKITELTIASFSATSILISLFLGLFYNFTEVAQITKAKMFLMQWLNLFDNKNIRYEDLRYRPVKRQRNYDLQVDPAGNTKQFFEQSKSSEKTKVDLKSPNRGIFYLLKTEVIDEYITYSASALLQGLCLILVIILLI